MCDVSDFVSVVDRRYRCEVVAWLQRGRRAVSALEASEIWQSVALASWRGGMVLASFDGDEGRLRAWVYSMICRARRWRAAEVARFLGMRMGGRARSSAALLRGVPLIPACGVPEAGEFSGVLRWGRRVCSPREWEAIDAVILQGFSTSEVAGLLDVTPQCVSLRIARGVAEMRAAIGGGEVEWSVRDVRDRGGVRGQRRAAA